MSTKLSPGEAARLLRHMAEDKPNPLAIAAYRRGKAVLAHVLTRAKP